MEESDNPQYWPEPSANWKFLDTADATILEAVLATKIIDEMSVLYHGSPPAVTCSRSYVCAPDVRALSVTVLAASVATQTNGNDRPPHPSARTRFNVTRTQGQQTGGTRVNMSASHKRVEQIK